MTISKDEMPAVKAIAAYAMALLHGVEMQDFEVDNLMVLCARYGASPTPAMKQRLDALRLHERQVIEYVKRLEKQVEDFPLPWWRKIFKR